MNRKRHRELLAALQPAVDLALAVKPERPVGEVVGFHFTNRVSADSAAELMIYGTIGGGGWFEDGITANDVAAALRDVGAGPINVRINSGGGDVFQGVAIHTLLVRHAGLVSIYVDGIAASAASFIAMAGDHVVAARNAFIMIHDGMTGTYGNAKTHRTGADLLDKVSDTIADIYAERAGEDVAHWRALMNENEEDGTWYTGQEALAAGLVDAITGGDEETDERATARLLAGWSKLLPTAARERVSLLNAAPEQDEQQTVEQTAELEPPEQPVAEQETDVQGQELAFAFLAAGINTNGARA